MLPEPYERGVSSQSPLHMDRNVSGVCPRRSIFGRAPWPRSRGQPFPKILDYRGIVLNQPIAALARLDLARAYVVQGDLAKARAQYQDFLWLWRNADRDIPILKQAVAENYRCSAGA